MIRLIFHGQAEETGRGVMIRHTNRVSLSRWLVAHCQPHNGACQLHAQSHRMGHTSGSCGIPTEGSTKIQPIVRLLARVFVCS